MSDSVDHPTHYTSHTSGVECVDIAEHLGFNLGNALKYLWRAGLKDAEDVDVRKAVWYLKRALRSGYDVQNVYYETHRFTERVMSVAETNWRLRAMLQWIDTDFSRVGLLSLVQQVGG